MKFLSDYTRSIDPLTGRRCWGPLRSDDPITYAEELEESVMDQREALIAARERMWLD